MGKDRMGVKTSMHKPVNLSSKSQSKLIKTTNSPPQQNETPQMTNEKDISHIQERYSYMNFGNITINYGANEHPKQPLFPEKEVKN